MLNSSMPEVPNRPPHGAVLAILAIAFWQSAGARVLAADWPMWRCDAGRTAFTAEALPDELHLQWVRRLPPQVPAWKDEAAMQFDRTYLPVVLGKRMFVGSTVTDNLTAYGVETGAEQWRFYCAGPVRVAPAAWRDKVYVASDDGCLYCLTAADGRLVWRFQGAPSQRLLIGNERLISTWPARGGPVLDDRNVYFAVGVWPFMGTFVYALDAESGRVVWSNDATSFTWVRLPHGSHGYSGLSPQGHLAIAGDRLIVPGSRAEPAVFDRT
ncbi:MAG: PQQ-binding-like beta-propeller repeat protein, partial [Tepidisphaeraceae bacterium]